MAMAAFDAPNAERVGKDTNLLHNVAQYMYTDGYNDIVSQLNDGKENLAATVGQIAGRLIANEYQMDSGAPEEEAPEEEGEEEPMGGAEAFGFDPHTMRNSAAKRAFSKHYGGK